MNRSILPLLLLLAGCAPAAGVDAVDGRPTRVMDAGGTADVYVRSSVHAEEVTISAPADSVFPALIQAFQDAGLVVSGVERASRVVGAQGMEISRRLGDLPLSTLVECGSSLSGPVVNTARVRLDVISRLVPARADQTTVRTTVTATARPTQGTSASVLGCTSTGRLEAQINQLLQQRLDG